MRRYDALVSDLDGVVYRGAVAVEHAVQVLSRLEIPVQYATNNASRPPAEAATHLRELGLRVTAGDIATSSQAAAAEVVRRLGDGVPVLTVGGPGVNLAAAEVGLQVVSALGDRPAAVIQGYGQDVSAKDLALAAYAIQAGAVWVATNLDKTLPTEFGIAPGNGSLIGAVQNAVGRAPDTVVGKPYAPLYLMCADRLGVMPERILAVGDRLDTDIEGANAAGMDSLLVLTGVNNLSDVATAPEERRPTYVARDLRALTEEALAVPRTSGQEWSCGADRGSIVAGEWVEVSAGSSVAGLTNRMYAVHAALDAGDIDAAMAQRILGSAQGAVEA